MARDINIYLKNKETKALNYIFCTLAINDSYALLAKNIYNTIGSSNIL